MIRWEQPGYLVGFTTRAGGVSSGAYESLNLTTGTGDDAALVEENRRIACAVLGLDAARLAFNRQVHSPVVRRASAGRRGEPGDGVWSDEPELPMLAMSADCLPIALARRVAPRALAVLHAGWRGLSEGVVAAGVAALGPGPKAAMIGPAIGPCCYEVGEEVAALFDCRPDRRSKARSLDRRRACAANARASRRSNARTCARAAIQSSSSRIGEAGLHGASRGCSVLSPDEIRTRFERVQSTVGAEVTVVAATKYVRSARHGAADRGRHHGRR